MPISQISDVRYMGPGRPEVLQLDGRLQWLTLAEEWGYFAETPNDSWGLSKNSGDNDARVVEVWLGPAFVKFTGPDPNLRQYPAIDFRGVESPLACAAL